MAACGIASSVTVPRLTVNVCDGRVRRPLEMQGGVAEVFISRLGCRLPNQAVRSVSSGSADRRAFARPAIESSTAGATSKEVFWMADGLSNMYPKLGSMSPTEAEVFRTRGWSEGALFKDGRLADLRVGEEFANGGGITEENMGRLVEALVSEEGRSAEDYRRRAALFNKIAEFFSQGKAYSVEKEDSSSSAAVAGWTMQRLVDVSLAAEGRSASDYHVRAQVFAKSAEVFPFNADIRLV